MNKITYLIMILTLTVAHAEKSREEAKQEAIAKINERYDIKEAKSLVKLRQKNTLKALKIKQKRELLEVELSKTK